MAWFLVQVYEKSSPLVVTPDRLFTTILLRAPDDAGARSRVEEYLVEQEFYSEEEIKTVFISVRCVHTSVDKGWLEISNEP